MDRHSECVAIIPARGGSKGVPRKNVRLLAGKPLIAHTIEQARLSERVERVIVSTDDAEIVEVAQQWGAEVVRRPAEISGDSASSEAALSHALEDLKDREAYSPDIVAFLQCTSPLTLAADIDGTIATLEAEIADSALAVTRFSHFLWEHNGDGHSVGINHDRRIRKLRQDQSPQYLETGAVYAMLVPGFLEARHRFFGKTALYEMPRERVLEIDEPADFEIAELLLRRQQRTTRQDLLPKPVGAVVFDFDGVFTDNRVLTLHDGQEGVLCDRSDGLGIGMLKATGLPVFVLSKEVNPVVAARCRKLKLEFRQGIEEKVPVLREWLRERGIDPANAVYVGNDINDLGCLGLVGCGVAVADAYPEAKAAAKFILSKPGGMGAVREICDLVRASLEGDRDAKNH